MKLTTEIKLKKQNDNQIDYHSKLLLLGSCFSENIGEKFNYFKFQSVSNPLGILFHPKAIENLIVRAIQQKEYSEKDIFFLNEQWHCYDAHSRLSNTSKDCLLNELNENLKLTNKQVRESTHIIITLGTAWVYSLIKSGETVANCHKVPQKEFNKQLLSIEQIEKSLLAIIDAIQSVNGRVSIIFTVSPVRHIKDGFIENTQSKSHLIAAIHSVVSPKADLKALFYFPSFEIMLDQLRDYRFYKADMLHPNTTAINFIWESFVEAWIASKSAKTMNDVNTIQKGLLHKPFNKTSEAYLGFIQQIKGKQELLRLKFSHILFDKL